METLGSQSVAHPPVGRFRLRVPQPDHPLVDRIADFEVEDELYLCEYHCQNEALLEASFTGEAAGFVEKVVEAESFGAAGNEPIRVRVIQDFCGAGRYALQTTEVCVRHSSLSFAFRKGVRIGLVFCCVTAFGCISSLPGVPRGLGLVEGEVRIGGGQSVRELGPAVVYLERTDERGVPGAGTLDLFDDRGPGLGHDLVVLVRGQSLRFVSRSGVAHRLFAIRGDERIEVAVPEHGESPSVPMERIGWIRFYCSLHQDENWDVFVSPSPHFARLDRQGRYRIEDVPHGDYQLSIWSAAVDGPVRPVHVGFGTATLESISLDPATIRP